MVIYGGGSDDSIVGSLFDDVIFAGSGNDIVMPGKGDDIVWAGDGSDHIFLGTGFDFVNGGSGNDRFHIAEGDTLEGGSGVDTIQDTLAYRKDNLTVSLNLAEGWHERSDSEHRSYVSEIEYYELVGNWHANIVGDTLDNYIRTDGGMDTILGSGGNDTLVSGSGSDILNGGSGDDYLIGDFGAYVMLGGGGNDTIYVDNPNDLAYGEGGFDHVVVATRNLPLDMSSWEGIERFDGSSASDSIDANSSSMPIRLCRNQGNDFWVARFADDTIIGGRRSDLLTGHNGADLLVGDFANGNTTSIERCGVDSLEYDNEFRTRNNIDKIILSNSESTSTSSVPPVALEHCPLRLDESIEFTLLADLGSTLIFVDF